MILNKTILDSELDEGSYYRNDPENDDPEEEDPFVPEPDESEELSGNPSYLPDFDEPEGSDGYY